MHIEGVVAQRRATDPWRKISNTVYLYAACTLQATRRGDKQTRRAGLEPVLIYCSLHAKRQRLWCAWAFTVSHCVCNIGSDTQSRYLRSIDFF